MCDINEQRKQECIKHSFIYHYEHFYILIGTMYFVGDKKTHKNPKYTKYFKKVHMR